MPQRILGGNPRILVIQETMIFLGWNPIEVDVRNAQLT